MTVVSGRITDEERKEIEVAKTEVRFHSNFNFLKATNGLRPREFIALVGSTGGGKSGICKNLSIDCVVSGHKCYTLLSEEKTSVYKDSVHKALTEAGAGKNVDKFLDKLFYESILDWDKKKMTPEYFLSNLEKKINEIQPELVIFDNFTTSFLEGLSIQKQGDLILDLRRLATDYDIAFFCVFHTAKGTDIYKKLITGEDVRGNAGSTNGGSYVYILTTYFSDEEVRAILTIEKARYHPLAQKTVWELNYNKELQLYVGDRKASRKTILEIMQNCNKLPPKPKAPRSDRWSGSDR
jgi:hypothetical protein